MIAWEMLTSVLETMVFNKEDTGQYDFRGADLSGGDFRNWKPHKIDLSNANLSECDLRGVDFSGAILSNTIIQNALYDDNTKWPDDFNTLQGRWTLANVIRSKSRFMNRDFHSCLFSSVDFEGAYFEECNFSYSDFQNVNFTDATFINCSFDWVISSKSTKWPKGFNVESKSILAPYTSHEKIDLLYLFSVNADLHCLTLNNGSMVDCTLKHSDLSRVKLFDVEIDGSDFARSTFQDGIFLGLRCWETTFDHCQFEGTLFCRGSLEHSELRHADFSDAIFRDIKLTDNTCSKSTFQRVYMQRVNTKSSNFEDANFRDSKLVDVSLENCLCKNADFSNATLIGVNFKGADMRGANFSGADLSRVNFRRHLFERERFSALDSGGEETRWNDAVYNEATIFPLGFFPGEHGMIKRGST